ncbi:MAG: multidrug efflux SMR transporter [Chlorobiales bacterium]|nr:multidrug efflux SMR transporter [Chlorobiales bacterium]
MAWVFLIIAGLLECMWAISLKYTDGLTRLFPSLITGVAMIASLWFLSLSLKTIPLGTAYTLWTGIGAAGVVITGMLFFHESRDIARVVCILLILSGVIGLKIFHGGIK